MAASSFLSLSTFLLISSLFWTPICSDESTISASPAVLPYVNAPDMSSFFPSPAKDRDRPVSSAVPPVSEAEAPSPSSGQVIGKSSGSSASAQPRSGPCLVLLVSLGVFSFYVLMTTFVS